MTALTYISLPSSDKLNLSKSSRFRLDESERYTRVEKHSVTQGFNDASYGYSNPLTRDVKSYKAHRNNRN